MSTQTAESVTNTKRKRRKGKKSPGAPRTVYVLEIAPKWHPTIAEGLAPGKSCLYVGETGKDPRERLHEHLTGKSLPGRKRQKRPAGPLGRMLEANDGRPLVEGVDVTLREDLAERFNARPLLGNEASEQAERRAVIALRRKGHAVYPTKVGSDVRKFADYKRAPARRNR